MNLLLDTCVSSLLARSIRTAGHDVVWTGDWEKDPGDDAIMAYAFQEDRVLLTLDKDFGALAVLHGKPHAGIMRLVNLSVAEQVDAAHQVLTAHATALAAGAIITVERRRVRIRLPN
jgi:predicted nuclease of predicted toxin-antitoxin system